MYNNDMIDAQMKLRGPYRRYTAYQTETLSELMIEEGKIAKSLHS